MNQQEKNKIYSVKELNELVKLTVDKNIDKNIYVTGELANLKISGPHSYFSLKNNESSINGVMWNNKIECNNGDVVNIECYVTFYIKNGTYQIAVKSIEKSGIGDIHEKYNVLKEQFEKKGYFNKIKNIPNDINSVGILTASNGAAIEDVLYVLKNNNFIGKVFIKNCNVQGDNCPISIKDGIKFFKEYSKNEQIDLLLITRGGGSMEDLMGFSQKDVVKTIYKCTIPTISAIGHEIDFMLSDFAADLRSPTPSIAASIICQNQKLNKNKILDYKNNLDKIKILIFSKLKSFCDDLIFCKNKLLIVSNIIENRTNNLLTIKNNIYNILNDKITKYKNQLDNLYYQQSTFNHNKILKNGYIIAVNDKGNIIKNYNDFKNIIENDDKKKSIKFIFHDGTFILNI
jgi:exodeoxyribonuclease VII large subunit